MDDYRPIPENERLQMEHLREIESEELRVEEVNDLSSDDDNGELEDNRDFTFDKSLATMHTYLGEVEDTHGRLAFFEGGTIVILPLLYLEGVVLFPEATLPLQVIRRSHKAAVEAAMNRADAPYTIAVVYVHRHHGDSWVNVPKVGTTAKIRQFRRVADVSLNLVTRGQQRFHLLRNWIDADGVPWAEVLIIQEDIPLRTPKDSFGQLASVGSVTNNSYSCMSHPDKHKKYKQQSYNDSNDNRSKGESMKVEHDPSGCFPHRSGELQQTSIGNSVGEITVNGDFQRRHFVESWERAADKSKWLHRAPRSFWPYWVYRLYDSYSLALVITDKWRQVIGAPSLDGLKRRPDLLSFYVASRIPVSESTRQELLEIDGVSYRLRKEIHLLDCFDLIRCRCCQNVIAKRTDLIVMSSDGPLNAYANPQGYVHHVLTVSRANGLSLYGPSVREHSWFPGYAWTIANCAECELNMGWLFTANNKKLQPRSFWGIQSIKVDDMV